MNRIYIFLLTMISMSSCLTGGFDENPQLEEHEEQLAKAPKVESITINGELLERNRESRRVIDASIGEELNISVALSSGNGGELEQLEFFRVYYYGEDFQEDPQPVEVDSEGVYNIAGDAYVFEYTYIVPEEDDDGFHFDPGYTILVYFRVKNSLDNFGYRAFEIHIVE